VYRLSSKSPKIVVKEVLTVKSSPTIIFSRHISA
jgi:hypothetical protein